MSENLDRFRRMLVYRGAGLGRFHCTWRSVCMVNIIMVGAREFWLVIR